VSSSHLPFKMHWVSFRALSSPYIKTGVRIELTKNNFIHTYAFAYAFAYACLLHDTFGGEENDFRKWPSNYKNVIEKLPERRGT